jgi:hypothetical protein
MEQFASVVKEPGQNRKKVHVSASISIAGFYAVKASCGFGAWHPFAVGNIGPATPALSVDRDTDADKG